MAPGVQSLNKKAVREIAAIVGDAYVSTRQDVLLSYSVSASTGYDSVIPGAVVRPGTTLEVAEVLKVANKYRIPVTPRCGGSSLQAEVIPKEGALVVELMRLEDISLYEDLRSITVGAGITYGKLDKFLKRHGLWVPFYPGSSLSATVAGNVSVNGSGFGSGVFGCIGELVLGLEVVLPNGTVIRTGSEANPNAPGPFLRYSFGPDLTGLFIGALGSLGIITKVSLKTYRRIEHYYYNTYGFQDANSLEKFLLELKENEVNALWMAVYEGRILEFFLDMAGEEFGIPSHEWPPLVVSMTIGRHRPDQLDSDADITGRICERYGGHVIGIGELPKAEWEDRLRKWIRMSYLHGWAWRMLYHHQSISNWHKSIDVIWETLDEFGIIGHTAGLQSGHASYNFYPQLYFDPQDSEEEERVRKAHKAMAKKLFKAGAVPFKLAPYWVEGIEEMESYMRLIRTLKATIDPNGIMNPGVLGGI
ncbi:MAG: FAD-binding oxidoreductase [Candidatus Thorarchaeota archaeon]|nr:FAD-binding oxidoreductase [Candidatus Thorarchaeota archaeon]